MHISINSGGILYIFSDERIKEVKQITYNGTSNEIHLKFPDEDIPPFICNQDFINAIVSILNQPV